MKKLLFTLVSLLAVDCILAQENYLYVPDMELTQTEAVEGVQGWGFFVVAHFDQYVTTVDWTINLPEGIEFVSGAMPNTAKPYSYQYVIDEHDGTDEFDVVLIRQRMNPQLLGEYPHYTFISSYEEWWDLCYSEDGSVCYGYPKWGGDGVEFRFYRILVNIAPGFTGGNILIHTKPSCTDDPRGNTCTGGEWDKVCPITVEQPATQPAPTPILSWDKETYTMTASCADHEVVLMINGVAVENPHTVLQTYEDQEITFEAYTKANTDESSNSETARETVIVPAMPIDPTVAIKETNAGKAIAKLRYFNMAGQEMQEVNGMTIVVTTYTDGTTNAVKVKK